MLHRRSAHALLVLGVAAVFPAVSAAQSRTFRNKAPAPAQPATVPSSLPAVPQTIPALRPLPEGRARVIPPIPNLSNRPGSSRSPSLSAHDKTVAVAWEELTEGAGDILVAISSDGGRTYGAPTNVSRSATASSSPEVVVTPSHVAVLWVERTASGPKPYAAVRAGGDPFGAPKILDAAAVDPRSLSLAGGAGYVGGLWLDTDGAAGVLKYADVLAGTVASVASDRALASPTLLRTADGTGAVTPTAIFARSGGLASARPSSPGARWTVLPLPSLGVPRGPLLARGEGRATAIGQQIDGPAFHALGTT